MSKEIISVISEPGGVNWPRGDLFQISGEAQRIFGSHVIIWRYLITDDWFINKNQLDNTRFDAESHQEMVNHFHLLRNNVQQQTEWIRKNSITLLAVRFHIVTSWPDLSKLSTAPDPISPRPRKPIFIGVAIIFFETKVSQRDGSTSGKNGCSVRSERFCTQHTIIW